MAQRIYKTANPFTRIVQQEFQYATDAQTIQSVNSSWESFKLQAQLSPQQRADQLIALVQTMNKRKEEMAKLITTEMGKPLTASLFEVQKSIDFCNWAASNGLTYLENEIIPNTYDKAYYTIKPKGPILLVAPFNSPFWVTFKMAVPNLLLGNTILVKPDENTPQSNLIINEIAQSAGIQDALQVHLYTYNQLEQIISDKRLAGVSVTGSGRAGSSVAQLAGKYLKKIVLELGGSDPFVVLNDVDIDKVVAKLVAGRMNTSGQVCFSPKRVIVSQDIYEEFVQKLVDYIQSNINQQPVDPMLGECKLGPMCREDLLVQLKRQVDQSVSMGARVRIGGEMVNETFYQATVLTDLTREMPVLREEVFGPVFCVIPFNNDNQAVEIANDTDLGLGGAVFSNDIQRAEQIADQIEAGQVFVNDLTTSLFGVSFGGHKDSGFGKELGYFGFREFANVKPILVRNKLV